MKPPILQTAVASYVFLIKNFSYALRCGWHYLFFLLLMFAGSVYFQTALLSTSDKEFEVVSSRISNLSTFLFAAGLVGAYFKAVLCISWIRKIADNSAFLCRPLKDYRLIFSCYFYSFFLSMVFLPPFSPLFLRFAAKANNQDISQHDAYRFFKGLKWRLLCTLILCFVPFFILHMLYTKYVIGFLLSGNLHLIPYFHIFSFLGLFLLPFVFCGVLSGYYLWFLQHPDWGKEKEESYYPTELNF